MAINKSEREFTTTDLTGSKITLLAIRPNQSVWDGARLEYSVKYAEALRAGALCRAEAEELIEKRHLWSPTHEEKLQQTRRDLRYNEVTLKKIRNLIEGKELAKQITAQRESITKLMSTRNEILARTCESYAESAQNQYLLVRCILRIEDKQPFFESLEAFKAMESSLLINDALATLMLFLMDLTNEDLTTTPEGSWLVEKGLKDKKTGFWLDNGVLTDDKGRRVDQDGFYLTTDGQKCDEFGFIIEEVEVKIATEDKTVETP